MCHNASWGLIFSSDYGLWFTIFNKNTLDTLVIKPPCSSPLCAQVLDIVAIVTTGAKPWQPSLSARWPCGPVTGEQGSGSKGKQLLSSIWCTEVELGRVKGQACQPLWGSAAMCLPYQWRAHVSAAGNAHALSCVSLSSCLSRCFQLYTDNVSGHRWDGDLLFTLQKRAENNI